MKTEISNHYNANHNTRILKGTVEALGQSQFDMQGHIYSYIRFLEEETNKVITVNNLIIFNNVNSYITNGTEATFYIAKCGKVDCLYALRTPNRFAEDFSMMSSTKTKLFSIGVLTLLMGIPLSIVLIGFLLIFMGLKTIYYGCNVPSRDELEEFSKS